MMLRTLRRLLLVGAAMVGVLPCGCGKKEARDETVRTAPSSSLVGVTTFDSGALAASPEAKAAQIYGTRCRGCHGAHGKGDGVLARTLTPPPRDYSDPAWQKATTDDQLRAVIAGGGASVHESTSMPASPDLADDPATLTAMVALVRSFAARP